MTIDLKPTDRRPDIYLQQIDNNDNLEGPMAQTVLEIQDT